MKRNVILFLICLLVCALSPMFGSSSPYYGDTPIPQGGAIGWDTGNDRFRAVPLASGGLAIPMSGNFSLGSFTINPDAPYSVYNSEYLNATNVSFHVNPLISRRFVNIVNCGTETVWINPGGQTATVSLSIPVLPNQFWGDTVDDLVLIPYVSSTPTRICVIQGR